MKILLTLILIVSTVFAQGESAQNWGERIVLGRTFVNTDSIRMKTVVDSLTAANKVLYSDLMPIPGSGTSRVWRVVVNMKDYATANTSDSVKIQIRLKYNFESVSETNFRRTFDLPASSTFGPWRTLFPRVTVGSLNILDISPTDSTWWGPANGRQYRVELLDLHNIGDTQPLITDYLN